MSARERILAAARDLVKEQDWNSVTMGELALRAAVSRQSVYNEFGTKAGVADALVNREVEAFLVAVEAQIAAGDSPADSATRACQSVFALAASNPVVAAAVTAAGGRPSPLLPLITSAALIDAVVTRAQAAMADRHGATDLHPELDAIVRLVISHIVNPAAPPDMAWIAERLLGPGIG